uniref:Uncharacterized protein MANES_01G229100 n=1 Tax=Rhizophora mucronata TaxID=61149 RepID=A0A2P2KFP9_RHIMU
MARIKPQALLQQSKKKKGLTSISATTILLCSFLVVLALFFLYSSYRNWSLRSEIQTEGGESRFEVDHESVDSKKLDLPGYAILSTSKGAITVELFKDSSPGVVDKFIDLWWVLEALH